MSGKQRITSALGQCPLFYGRPIHALVATCTLRTFADGHPILRVGEPAAHLVVLVTGAAGTFSRRADGSPHPLRRYRAPQVFGEEGLYATDRTRWIGADALGAAEVVLVPRDALLQAAEEDGVLAHRLLTLVADTATPPVDGTADLGARILADLESLAARAGRRTDEGGVRLGLRLTRADVAALVGADADEVGPAIRQLVRAGALGRVDGYFVLPPRS